MTDFTLFDAGIDSPEGDKRALYEGLRAAADALLPNADVNVCWRLAKGALVLADAAEQHRRSDECKAFVTKAVNHAKMAIEADPECVAAHKWYCASVGRIAPFSGTRARIQYGHEFKKHADIALAKDPEDRLLHHMYGRWCYEVAGLSWMERKLAATFFGAPPVSSYEEALSALMRANQLRRDWISNHLWIAKVLFANNKTADALPWLDSGLALTPLTEDDAVAREQLMELHRKQHKK